MPALPQTGNRLCGLGTWRAGGRCGDAFAHALQAATEGAVGGEDGRGGVLKGGAGGFEGALAWVGIVGLRGGGGVGAAAEGAGYRGHGGGSRGHHSLLHDSEHGHSWFDNEEH